MATDGGSAAHVSPGGRQPADVLRSMVAAFTSGRVSSAPSYIHPEYLDHQGITGHPMHGPEGFVRIVQMVRRRYSHLSIAIQNVQVHGDEIQAQLTWEGLRLSGRAFRRVTTERIWISAGQAIEHWGSMHKSTPSRRPARY